MNEKIVFSSRKSANSGSKIPIGTKNAKLRSQKCQSV